MVVVAAALTAGLYTLASLGKLGAPPPNILPFLGVVLALLLAAHLAVRFLAKEADPIMLPMALLLNGIGYVFIGRLKQQNASRQALWIFVGIVAFTLTLLVVRRVRDLERYRYLFGLVGLGLLLMPLLPIIGNEQNGSRIWVRLGPVGFQPGELAKISLAIFFASYLTEQRELLGAKRKIGFLRVPEIRLRVLAPIVFAWGFAILIMVAEKDLGSSLLFFSLFIAMLWTATGQTWFVGIGLGAFSMAAVAAWKVFRHVQVRVTTWLNPWADAQNKGYQITQSMFAFGSGGIDGAGLALGNPGRIPVVESDFIFAAIGEEMGLIGTAAVLVAYLLIIGSGLRVAMRVEHPFTKVLAVGLTFAFGMQTFIIIGGVTRLIPLTGITLPFVSYGGSALVANYILLALLLRISDEANR